MNEHEASASHPDQLHPAEGTPIDKCLGKCSKGEVIPNHGLLTPVGTWGATSTETHLVGRELFQDTKPHPSEDSFGLKLGSETSSVSLCMSFRICKIAVVTVAFLLGLCED